MIQRLGPLLLLSAAILAAQGTVSVMAGYLYRVDGEVKVGGESISPKPANLVHLRDGERLETQSGRVEMMLYPGSFMRVAPHSTVEMVDAGLLSAELRVVEGAVTVDLEDLLEKGAILVHVGEEHDVEALGPGVFRIDAPPKGPGRVRVISGKTAVWADGSQTVIKKGREIGLSAGATAAKTDDELDELDRWQSQRHEELAAAARTNRAKKTAGGGLDALDREILGMDQRRP